MWKIVRFKRCLFAMLLGFLIIFIPIIQGQDEIDLPALGQGSGAVSMSLETYSPHNQVSWVLGTLLPFSALRVKVDYIPPDISFIVFQAHAFLYNISVSYNASLVPHYHVNGSNIGLVGKPKLGPLVFHIFNDNMENVTAMLVVVAYNSYAPVPGGCNLEFDVETAPYLQLQQMEATVVIDTQPAKSPGSSCEKMAVTHEMYRTYLDERDFSQNSYFAAIQSMLTPRDVAVNGTLAPVPLLGSSMRRVYSLYPGTGSVYVTLARSSTGEAVYIPTVTYGCSALYFIDSCTVLTTTFSKVLSAFVFFLGLFACFFGHTFFKTEIFLAGCLAGGLVSYIAVRNLTLLSSSLSVSLACLVGATTGMVWLLFWCIYGIPVVTIVFLSMTLGFVFASVIFFAGLGDLSFAQVDIDFWLTFCCLMMTLAVILLPLSHHASILVSSIVGSYAVAVPIDHYIGGSLKYIIINTLRRATVSGFEMAIVDPPFQYRDGLLVALWAVLALAGGFTQTRRQKGRPPFLAGTYQRPTPRSSVRPVPGAGHHTPTARTALRVSSYIPRRYGSLGDDDVFETPPDQRRSYRFWRWINSWRSQRTGQSIIATQQADVA